MSTFKPLMAMRARGASGGVGVGVGVGVADDKLEGAAVGAIWKGEFTGIAGAAMMCSTSGESIPIRVTFCPSRSSPAMPEARSTGTAMAR